MADRLLTTVEIAEVLRVHPKHVYRLLKKGLPARRVGSEWRFSRADVLAWSGGAPGEDREAGAAGATSAAPEDGAPSLVAANGDVAIHVLLRLAAAKGPPLLGFVQADMRTAAELLRARAILAAGAHAGDFPGHVGEERVARLHLVQREIGLVHREKRPLRPAELTRKRLATRPASAGVRRYLDEALRKAGLDPAKVQKGALVLDSHLDVVLAVGAGRADVGLCSRAWGERAGLAFQPLATEAYGLIVKARDLGDARVVRLCEVAQGAAFRSEVGALAGYDPAGSGDIRYDA
jgi:putative molybdopterin biosynthesis protein